MLLEKARSSCQELFPSSRGSRSVFSAVPLRSRFWVMNKQQWARCELQSPGAWKKNALLNHAGVSDGDGVVDVDSICTPGASEGIAFPLLPPKIH